MAAGHGNALTWGVWPLPAGSKAESLCPRMRLPTLPCARPTVRRIRTRTATRTLYRQLALGRGNAPLPVCLGLVLPPLAPPFPPFSLPSTFPPLTGKLLQPPTPTTRWYVVRKEGMCEGVLGVLGCAGLSSPCVVLRFASLTHLTPHSSLSPHTVWRRQRCGQGRQGREGREGGQRQARSSVPILPCGSPGM